MSLLILHKPSPNMPAPIIMSAEQKAPGDVSKSKIEKIVLYMLMAIFQAGLLGGFCNEAPVISPAMNSMNGDSMLFPTIP